MRALSIAARGLAVAAAFWLLVPDAVFALAFGWTQLGLARPGGGALEIVFPDAARAVGVGRLMFFAAAFACAAGMEKRRGFLVGDEGRMPALYDFPKRAAGGFCVVGIFGYTLGIMLHFFETWSVAAVVFAVMLGGILSFHVLGAMASDGSPGPSDSDSVIGGPGLNGLENVGA